MNTHTHIHTPLQEIMKHSFLDTEIFWSQQGKVTGWDLGLRDEAQAESVLGESRGLRLSSSTTGENTHAF